MPKPCAGAKCAIVPIIRHLSILVSGCRRCGAHQSCKFTLPLLCIWELQGGAALRIEPQAVTKRCHYRRLLICNPDPGTRLRTAALTCGRPLKAGGVDLMRSALVSYPSHGEC